MGAFWAAGGTNGLGPKVLSESEAGPRYPAAMNTGFSRLLGRLGLNRPELRAWVAYDWANSAMATVIITAIFPIFFLEVAADGWGDGKGEQAFSLTTTLALATVAMLAPILGPIADVRGWSKRLLGAFLVVGILSTGGMFFVGYGDARLALILFYLANVGAAGSFVFYDSLLPHVARPDEVDRVSTTGYSAGYLGGGLLLLLALIWISNPGWFGLPSGESLTPREETLPTRLAFLAVAIWWAVFSLPLFYNVPEPPPTRTSDEGPGESTLTIAVRRLKKTLGEIRQSPDALWMMIAFLLYNDGIQTILRLATILGAARDFEAKTMIRSILLVQFVGIPFAILFSKLSARVGIKRAIFTGIFSYIGIVLAAVYMNSELHFLGLAVGVGMVMGGTQALSRSLFATLIPHQKSSEFFALFGVFEKFAGIFGPLLFTLVLGLLPAGRENLAAFSVLPFFLVGALAFSKVDVKRGRARARAQELELSRA